MFRSCRRPAILVAALALSVPTAVLSATGATPAAGPPAASAAASASVQTARQAPRRKAHRKAVFFASDGMRQDLVEKYARAGSDADHARRSCGTGRPPRATGC